MPLPTIDPPDDIPAIDWAGFRPRVTDALLPEWTLDTLNSEDWHTTDDAYMDNDFGLEALPFWVQNETTGWVRACDFIGKVHLHQLNHGGSCIDEKKKKEEKTGPAKAKGKEALQEWREADTDELPQIVVLPQFFSPVIRNVEMGAMAKQQWPPSRALPLVRGFATVKLQTQARKDQVAEDEGSLSKFNGVASVVKSTVGEESAIEVDIKGDFTTATTLDTKIEMGDLLPERDAIGASILRLVATYTGSGGGPENAPFLWEAIYPQDVAGRPCYNPGGKYAVKLFVCGLWRKVLVDDQIPIDSSGHATVVSSREHRELWPLILAKAAYKVAHFVGRAAPTASSPITNAASEIISVAVAALTGWLPSPVYPPSLLGQKSCLMPRMTNAFAKRIIAGGTPRIDTNEIALLPTSGLPGCPSKRRHMKSGRRRRRGRSREPSEEMLNQAALARNNAVSLMREKFSAARDELVLVVDTNIDGSAILRPILAFVSMPGNKCEGEEANEALLEWSCVAAKSRDYKPGATVPPTKTWAVPLNELFDCAGTARILALTTRRNMAYTAQARRHWVTTVDGTGFIPPPPLSPTVLHVEATRQSATLTVALQADVLDLAKDCNHEKEIEAGSPPISPMHGLDTRNVTLVLEEIVVPTRNASPSEETATQFLNADSNSSCLDNVSKVPGLEDFKHKTATLTMSSSPLVSLRIVLSLSGSNPTTTAVLHVPPAHKGRLYRLSIDAPLGAIAIFCCNSPIACDDASATYGRLGGSAVTSEGKYCAIHHDCEAVLFRRLIVLPAIPASEAACAKTASDEELEVQAEEMLKTKAFTESMFVDFSLDLWLSDATTADHVTLHTFDMDSSVTTSHPLLHLQKMRVARGSKGSIITATLQTSRHVPVPSGTWSLVALTESSERSNIPPLAIQEIDDEASGGAIRYQFGAFYTPNKHLRLFRDVLEVPSACFPLYINLDILHTDNAKCPTPENNDPMGPRLSTRFGVYEMAKKARRASTGLGRNDKDTFIAAANMSDGAKGVQLIQQIGVRSICLPCFWPKQFQRAERTGTVETTAALLSNVHQLVLDAELDSDVLQVDETLCSPNPYAYHDNVPAEYACDIELPVQPLIKMSVQWVLTLYAAAEGVQLRHDADEERARQALRKNWESLETGRTERSALLRANFLEDRTPPIKNTEHNLEELAALRASTLGAKLVTLELEAGREEKRLTLHKPTVNVDEKHPVRVVVLSKEQRESRAEAFSEVLAMSEDTASKVLRRGQLDIAIQTNEETEHVNKILKWRRLFTKGSVGTLKTREQHRDAAQQKTSALDFLQHRGRHAAFETAGRQRRVEEQKTAEANGDAFKEEMIDVEEY